MIRNAVVSLASSKKVMHLPPLHSVRSPAIVLSCYSVWSPNLVIKIRGCDEQIITDTLDLEATVSRGLKGCVQNVHVKFGIYYKQKFARPLRLRVLLIKPQEISYSSSRCGNSQETVNT